VTTSEARHLQDQRPAFRFTWLDLVSAVELAPVSAWLDKRVADMLVLMLVLQPVPSYMFL